MSQHDFDVANAPGATFRADTNLALVALASNSSGASEPSTTYAYQFWADTTSGWLKQRNAANSGWIKRLPLGTAARVDVASAATLDLDANAANSSYLRITGTTTITAVTLTDGQQRLALAGGAFVLTHGASLVLPGATNYTTTAGDLILFIGEASSVVRVMIWRGDGSPAVSIDQLIHAATSKSTPVDADELGIYDSVAAALKKLTWANLKATLLATVNSWTAAQRGAYTSLTDAATIAVDFSLGNNFDVILGGNRTLGVPTNPGRGQSGVIDLWQDGTGSRLLSFAWCWQFPGGTAPTLSTGKFTRDVLAYEVARYATSTVTISIATPGVVTWTAHGLRSGDIIQLTTTGALPTGLSASTSYWVTKVDADTFKLSTSLANAQAGTYIATSGSQSGTHTCTNFMISAALNAGMA